MVAENAIFISYRRSDSNDVTGWICDRLKAHFGADAVFIDYDDIPYGADFPDHLQQKVDGAKVLLAVIGPAWLNTLTERLDESRTDWVRAEIERALSQKNVVIPVRVNGAQVPDVTELPGGMQAFPRKNAAEVRAGRDFDTDIKELCKQLESILGEPESEALSVDDAVRGKCDLPVHEQVKLNALEKRRAVILKKYEAASTQLSGTLSAADKVTIQAQVNAIDNELQQVIKEISSLLS